MIQDLKANPPPVPVDDIAEAIQFLEWVAADNFTLLGVRDYTLDRQEDERDLKPVLETGLGVLRGGDVPVLTRGGQAVSITPQLRAFFDEPKTLIVTKANVKSRVHRRVYLDYIGVKRFDADGNPSGEFRIVGLFTSTAYIRSIRSIPYLRRKVDAVLTPRRLQSGDAFRQGAGQRAGDLSARRAVPDRRGHALSFRAEHPAARRAPAGARAGAARPLRPFRLGAGLCAARALQRRRCARRSANISPRSSRATSAPTIRTSTKRR